MLKAKLTPIGNFSKAYVIDNVLQIAKVGKNTIFISYHCKDYYGDIFTKGESIDLNEWTLQIWLEQEAKE